MVAPVLSGVILDHGGCPKANSAALVTSSHHTRVPPGLDLKHVFVPRYGSEVLLASSSCFAPRYGSEVLLASSSFFAPRYGSEVLLASSSCFAPRRTSLMNVTMKGFKRIAREAAAGGLVTGEGGARGHISEAGPGPASGAAGC